MLHNVVWSKLTDVSEVLTASIITAMIATAMMEAVRTSEMSVSFKQATRRNIPDESSPLSPSSVTVLSV